ncbi:MAG: hypothetical protein K2X87_29345 [Gemmataceae bacterium]|nr:hypothetical protein [Gemmataceae bacterium]
MSTRRAWAAGFGSGLAVAAVAWSMGGTRAADEKPAKAELPPVPAELVALNRTTGMLYAGGRKRELATVPAVVIVSGDDLILRRGDKRATATVIPPEYHALKAVAHVTLGLFGHLAADPGKPLGDDRVKRLTEYRGQLAAAAPAVEGYGYDADTLARQKRMIDRGLAFIDKVLADGQVSADDLTRYCRASRPDVMANCAAAARAQLAATHKQMMAWKAEMTADEWAGLAAVIPGRQTPRAENAAVQYFARLWGEPGECRRIVYAEGLFVEEQAVDLLGTLRLDGKLAVAVFDDPYRMYRDVLADGARSALDDIFAAP